LATLVRESLRGGAQPRILVAPQAAYSLGPECAELSAAAGLPLYPYQREGLDIMLGVRDDGQWACFEYCELCSRQNGKTTGLFAPRALFGLLMLPERLVLWSAHRYATVLESFRVVQQMIYTLGYELKPNLVAIEGDNGVVRIKINNTNGEESFERLDTRARIKFIARSKATGRGMSGDCNLLDEAFALTEEHKEALGPTTLAMPNPQICYASSPPLDGLTGWPLFDLRDRALAGDDGLGYRDWGIEGCLDEVHKVDLDDCENWERANPGLGYRLTAEKMLRLRTMLSDKGFGRECLGLWPKRIGDGNLIDRRIWAALADSVSTIEGPPAVMAFDVSPGERSGAIATAGRRSDGIPHVEITGGGGQLDNRDGIDWMVPRIVELDQRWSPIWLAEPDGPARVLLGPLREAGVRLHLITGREYGGACAACLKAVNAVERDGLRHLGQAPLTTATGAAKKRDVGDGAWAWGRKASDLDISPLVAVTLALHGLMVYGGAGLIEGSLMA